MNTPFWFIVPLRAKATCNNWEKVSHDLRETLRSLINQTDHRFRIIISCTDEPDLGDINDTRITVISDHYPIPKDFMGYATDKRAKKRAAAMLIRGWGGGYIMLVDADDYVSRSIVEHTLRFDNKNGYYIETGYLFYSDTNNIKRIGDFYKKCGTCFTCYFESKNLPASIEDTDTDFDKFTNHRLCIAIAADQGKVLEPYPFDGAVYRLESGENISRSHPNARRLGRTAFFEAMRAFTRQISARPSIPDHISHDFSISVN